MIDDLGLRSSRLRRRHHPSAWPLTRHSAWLRSSRLRAVGIAAVAVLGAAAQSANAASTPLAIDPSSSAELPAVAVADDGTAHIAWVVRTGGGDRVHYCRLRRTVDTCDQPASWLPNSASTQAAPIVLLRSPTRIQIVMGRSNETDATYLVESTNGGATFSVPRLISPIAADTAVAGPGNNGVTLAQATASPLGFDRVQVADTTGTTVPTASFPVQGQDRTQYPGLGLINAGATPVYAYTQGSDTVLRRFDTTKSGYNNAANWVALPQTVPGEDLLGMASNPNAGTYVLTHTQLNGEALQDVLRVRRINEFNGQLEAPMQATPPGEPRFAALTAGNDGALTAVWSLVGDPAPIRVAVAGPGAGFGSPGTLVESAAGYNLATAVAADRGGIVAWDGNLGSGVYVARIPVGGQPADPPPPPPPGATPAPPTPTPTPAPVAGACKLQIKPGIDALALGGPGCWVETPKSSKRYTFDGTVSINGLVLTAPVGAKTGVVVDLAKRTVTAPKGTQQRAGSVILSDRAVDWNFNASLTQTFTKLETAAGGKPVRLLGFPVIGDASITFGSGEATIRPQLQLPFPFDGPTAAITLTLSQSGGLDLDGASFDVNETWIGPLQVKALHVEVSSSIERFAGSAQIRLPGTGTDIKVTVAFESGSLVQFSAAATNLPPIGIGPAVFLRGVGFNYQDDQSGFTLGGGADLAFPTPDGGFWFNALGDPPGTGKGFSLHVPKGTKSVIITFGGDFEFGTPSSRLAFASVNASLDSQAKQVTFGANVRFGVPDVVGIFGDFKGGIGYGTGNFSFEGKLRVCLLGCGNLRAIVSSEGAAACVDFVFVELLVGYRYNTGLDAGLTCNLGPYTPAEFGGSGGSAPAKVVEEKPILASKDTVSLPPPAAQPKAVSIEVRGAPGGGVPGVRLTAAATSLADNGNGTYTAKTAPPSPDDPLLVESDPNDLARPQTNGDVIMVPNPATDSVRITVLRRSTDQILKDGTGTFPAGRGAIRIEQAGGNPIQFGSVPAGSGARARRFADGGIVVAREYPAARARVTVSGKGRRRTVKWNASDIGGPTGRTLVLMERQKSGATKLIRRTTATSGSASFTIADGSGGRRQIAAIIENAAGISVDDRTAATFTAPPPITPSKARVRLRLGSGGKVTASWSAIRNANQAIVTVATGDGRRFTTSTKRRSLVIPRISKTERLTVSVTGITRDGRLGPTASARRGTGK